MLKQIKQIIITFMMMFKVIPGRPTPNEVANDMYLVFNDAEHGGLFVVYSARHRGFLARVF